MTLCNKAIAITIFLIVGSGYAKDRYSAQSAVGVSLKCTEDLTLSLRGVAHGGQQLEHAKFYSGKYKASGFTAWEGAAGFGVIVGKMGNLEISTGGEILMRTRKLADTAEKSEFNEYSPTLLLGLNLPLVAGAKVDFINRMERRNFRSPLNKNSPEAHLRWVPRMQITSMELSPIKLSGYCYYEGASQESADHQSGWGTGINLFPLKPLRVQGAFSSRWLSYKKNTVVHQVELNLDYTIDLTKKK